jgi:hypothetical protein
LNEDLGGVATILPFNFGVMSEGADLLEERLLLLSRNYNSFVRNHRVGGAIDCCEDPEIPQEIVIPDVDVEEHRLVNQTDDEQHSEQ